MTREEKIRNASIKYTLKNKSKFICGDMEDEFNRNHAFEEGAKWADETMIENACKWLIEQKEMIGISFQEDFIERFKMAMKK